MKTETTAKQIFTKIGLWNIDEKLSKHCSYIVLFITTAKLICHRTSFLSFDAFINFFANTYY